MNVSYFRISILMFAAMILSMASRAGDPRECLKQKTADQCRECVTEQCSEELRRLGDEVGETAAKAALDAARRKASVDKSKETEAALEAANRQLDAARQLRTTRFRASPCQAQGKALMDECSKRR